MRINYFGKVAAALFVGLTLATGCASSSPTTSAGPSNNQDETADVSVADPYASAAPDTVVETSTVEVSTVEVSTAEPQTVEVAAEPQQNIRYFVDGSGLAIRGTDPVTYFTQGGPVAGSAEFTYTWGNATWQFASAENRDLFAANPEQYAPQYGGFCAWAVSQGYTASIDPNAWRIVDGKLYLNYSKGVQRQWERDIPGNISQANANWPGVLADS